MPIAVEFDDKSNLRRVVIRDVATERMLSTELEPAQLAIAEFAPQKLFAWRRFMSHLSREFEQSGIDSHSGLSMAYKNCQ